MKMMNGMKQLEELQCTTSAVNRLAVKLGKLTGRRVGGYSPFALGFENHKGVHLLKGKCL